MKITVEFDSIEELNEHFNPAGNSSLILSIDELGERVLYALDKANKTGPSPEVDEVSF